MPGSPHPLDPLSAEEISRAAAIVRNEHAHGDRWRFACIELVEPAKTTLAQWHEGEPGCIPTVLGSASPLLERAPVIGHPLWVTRQADEERWPAGDYPAQGHGEEGIGRWVAQDRPLEDADVVLRYVFGIHHITGVEDWPVMAGDTVSFWLKPFGFFDRNPALDVTPERGH